MQPIGTVISGTMRPEDLIPAFIDKATELLHDVDCPLKGEFNGRANAELGEVERRMEGVGYFDSEDAEHDLEYLFDLLDSLAPEGTYFGAHPGDGADYGFWAEEDAME